MRPATMNRQAATDCGGWRAGHNRSEHPGARSLAAPPWAGDLAPLPHLRLDVLGAREMAEHRSGWSREFDEPIALPDGGTLVTLRDAADFITALPDEEAAMPEWEAAIEALMLVADLGGPTMFARIGVMRALNRRHVRVFNPARKDHHWGRRKLKRDEYVKLCRPNVRLGNVGYDAIAHAA
jgi:hypothetical protein